MSAVLSRKMVEPPPLPAVTSIVPPAPIAPGLLEQVNALSDVISGHEARIGALALGEAQGEAGASQALVELEAAIAVARAEHAKKSAAHKAALVADRTALEKHSAWIRTLPTETLIAGITREKCPDLCHAGGCALACGLGICMHPRRSGIPPRHQADRTIRDNHHAANREILRQEQDR
jgi:hypothetical protein